MPFYRLLIFFIIDFFEKIFHANDVPDFIDVVFWGKNFERKSDHKKILHNYQACKDYCYTCTISLLNFEH